MTKDVEEIKRVMGHMDIAILCVANTPLTLNSEHGLKQCIAWLLELKQSVAAQLREKMENENGGECQHPGWIRLPEGNMSCEKCGHLAQVGDVFAKEDA